MQVYWSSIFILPKRVIRDIENLLRSFLWSGTDLKKHSAKIAWKHVCKKKNEGGLGFKDMEVWNRADNPLRENKNRRPINLHREENRLDELGSTSIR